MPTSSTPVQTLDEPPVSPTFPPVYNGGLELGDAASTVHATLGPFELHDVLGRGGMGVVFSGVHLATGVAVAIKVITRRGANHPHFRRSMHNEVRSVASLDHPGIVRVLDYGDISESAERLTEGALNAGSPYFAMEMMPHGALIDVMGRVTWRQGKALLLSLLDALAHAHARDVIHRDIKPGNILLDDWGGHVIPRLADFGLAFALNVPTDVSRSIGTPQYMAPEQIETPWREHGPWSDLYSLGCVAYELFTGRKMFQGKSIIEIFRLHLDGARRPLRSVVRLPRGFHLWLDRMLSRNPADRFQCAAEAAHALMRLDDSEVPEVSPPEPIHHAFATLCPVLGINAAGPAQVREPDQLTWPKRYPTPMRLVGAGLGLYGLRQHSLVGRDDELDAMWEAFRACTKEGPRALTIVGASGVGKTKVATSFTQRLAELGLATVLEVEHSAEKQQDGLASLFAAYFRVLGASRVEASGVVREKLLNLGCEDSYLWRAAAELVTPALSEDISDSQFEFPTKALRLDSAARLLDLQAQTGPIVVVMDDVHYGVQSLEFVRFVLDRGIDTPILFVLLATEERLPEAPEASTLLDGLRETKRARRLDVDPLDDVAHLLLVQNLLHLTGDVAIQVAARTAGNPRFATELIGDWVERGILSVDETGFVPRRDLSRRIPDSLVDVWAARLKVVLDEWPQARQSLELAAALGSSVRFEEWAGVCAAAGLTVDLGVVDTLLEHRLATEGRERWSFTHPGIPESLKRSALAEGRWKRWKAACAAYLTATGRTRAEVLSRIGQYWLEAENFAEAAEPLMLAARIRERQGDYRATEEAIAGLIQCVENLDDRERRLAQVCVFRARAYIGWGRPDEALRWARKAMEAAEANQWVDLRANATAYVALAKQWMGAKDALEWFDRALDAVGCVSASFVSDGALVALAYMATSIGRFEEAERILDTDERSSPDERGRAGNQYQRCRLLIYRGELERAVAPGEAALAYYKEAGHVPAMASTLAMLAEVQRKSRNFEEAERLYREVAKLQKTLGQSALVATISLAQVVLENGATESAEALFLEASREAATANRRRFEMVCIAGLLVCAVKRGQRQAVQKFLPRLEEFMKEAKEAIADVGELLEMAAAELATSGNVADLQRTWRVALIQWEIVGDEARVQAAREHLDRLDEQSA